MGATYLHVTALASPSSAQALRTKSRPVPPRPDSVDLCYLCTKKCRTVYVSYVVVAAWVAGLESHLSVFASTTSRLRS